VTSPVSQHTRILAITNQKGGVGKTTTAINLGTALAAIGEEVLIVDIDPQCNASTGLGITRDDRMYSSYELLSQQASLDEAALKTTVPKLSIIPSTLDLLGFELEVASLQNRSHRLRDAIEKHIADKEGKESEVPRFTYILIDCPPSLNLLTVNAMVAAQALIVPLQCEFFALEGLSQLLKTVRQIKQSLNRLLIIHGIVITMFDPRNKLSSQVTEDVRQTMGDLVYNTVIPRNIRLSEAPSHGKPAVVYDLSCSGSQAYLRLAAEILQREQQLRGEQ